MIKINLVFPDKETKKVEVRGEMPVQTLESFYPQINSAFLMHNGQIVLPSFSFRYVDIKDGDTVFVIKCDATTLKISQPKPKYDTEIIRQCAKMNGINPKVPPHLIMEGLRLKDLYFAKKESAFYTKNFKN